MQAGNGGSCSATALAACGDVTTAARAAKEAGGDKAPATIPELTKDPVNLRFIWFEWPPAQALEDFANAEYTKERPNVTIEVNTVPNANWHDAMFTQFAARQTDFDIAILDSQHIGEAVTNGNILDITDFVKSRALRWLGLLTESGWYRWCASRPGGGAAGLAADQELAEYETDEHQAPRGDSPRMIVRSHCFPPFSQ